MKKLRLIAVRSQKEEILRELLLLGCVEITEPAAEPQEELLRTLHRSGGGAARSRGEQGKLLNALRLLDQYAPYKKGLLTPLPEVTVETLLSEDALAEDLSAAERIISLDAEVRAITARESRERAVLESLQPWRTLDMPLEYDGTKTCDWLLGALPITVSEAQAAAALSELDANVEQIHEDKTDRYIAVVFRREERDKVLSALREENFSQVTFPGIVGTPEENLALSTQRLEQMAAEKEEKTALIAAESVNRSALQLGADTLSSVIARGEVSDRLLHSESTFYFAGWLSAPEEAKLSAVLDKYDCAWETEDPDPEHPEEVPVKLKNNALTRPYNVVTEMYSLPAYNGLDPNPFLMPFFALFFGMMFADMAYGLLLLIAGLIFTFKAKPRGTMKNMAGLLIQCGISTFVIGFLTGGFFGDAVTQIGLWFGRDWSMVPPLGAIRLGSIEVSLPLDLLAGNNPLYVLIFSIVLGAVHLLVGVAIGMFLKIRDGQWIDAVCNDFSWWVIIAGIGLMALGKGTTVLWIGVAMMVLGVVLTNKGLKRITGIFGAVYNGATGYLGDFLSYSRLMALMLAGSVIASVFNQLGSLGNANGPTVGGTIMFVLVFLIGHGLNFALNLIGCFVHTMRLQFLEFFGKWYRDGGRAFRPLQIKTNFVDIKEE